MLSLTFEFCFWNFSPSSGEGVGEKERANNTTIGAAVVHNNATIVVVVEFLLHLEYIQIQSLILLHLLPHHR